MPSDGEPETCLGRTVVLLGGLDAYADGDVVPNCRCPFPATRVVVAVLSLLVLWDLTLINH